MTSYQTVQIVAYTATPIATDYIALAPGYTFSLGSVSIGGGPGVSSGTSFTPTSELSFTVGASNVTMGLPYIIAAGSGCSVTYDATGRVTAAATSITTASVTGTWTSDVSAANVFASTASASNITSRLSILANEVWASGFSALGSIATLSRVSSGVSIVANEVWASGLSVGSVLTTLNFADNQATSFRVENRTADPGSPSVGQIWLRTDL